MPGHLQTQSDHVLQLQASLGKLLVTCPQLDSSGSVNSGISDLPQNPAPGSVVVCAPVPGAAAEVQALNAGARDQTPHHPEQVRCIPA